MSSRNPRAPSFTPQKIISSNEVGALYRSYEHGRNAPTYSKATKREELYKPHPNLLTVDACYDYFFIFYIFHTSTF